MKKRLFLFSALVFAIFTSANLFAQNASATVDMDFLSKAKRETYIEDNSAVSRKDYNTGKQIRDMGRRLGAEVRYQSEVNKALYPFSSGYPDYKYKASRVYPGKKAGADVIYLGRLSRLGTFKNLNRVVSGYIEKAYGVSMEQADQIAMKVCYWNTNHYEDKAYFRSNFEPRVLEVFENRTKTIGLAPSYKNWPGNARIVIPFTIVKEIVPDAIELATPKTEVEATEAISEKVKVEEKKVETVSEQKIENSPPANSESPKTSTNQIQKGTQKDVSKNSGKINPLIFIIGGVGILLVIILIIIIAARSKKKKNME